MVRSRDIRLTDRKPNQFVNEVQLGRSTVPASLRHCYMTQPYLSVTLSVKRESIQCPFQVFRNQQLESKEINILKKYIHAI